MLLTSVVQMDALLDLYEKYANWQQINDYAKDLILCGMNTDIMNITIILQIMNENEVND